jgi:hypothetical protein
MYGAVENTGDISNIDEVIDLCHLHTEFPRVAAYVSRSQLAESAHQSLSHQPHRWTINVNGEDEMTNYLCVHTLTCEYSR